MMCCFLCRANRIEHRVQYVCWTLKNSIYRLYIYILLGTNLKFIYYVLSVETLSHPNPNAA